MPTGSTHRPDRADSPRRSSASSAPASACSGWPSLLRPRGRAATPAPLAPKPHFAAAGEAGHLPVHGRRAVARRHVRPQAGLAKYAGQAARPRPTCGPSAVTGGLMPSPFTFAARRERARGQRPLPHLARCADDLCVVRSIHATNPNHAPARHFMAHRPRPTPIHPSLGAWLSYGLGTENRTCPASSSRPGGRVRSGRALSEQLPARPSTRARPSTSPRPTRSRSIRHLDNPAVGPDDQQRQLDAARKP